MQSVYVNSESDLASVLHAAIHTMLDSFEILSTSGVVLWSRSYASVNPSVINGLIKDVFIEEKTLPGAVVADDTSAAKNPPYRRDKYTLKWTSVKDLNLIFVVRDLAYLYQVTC